MGIYPLVTDIDVNHGPFIEDYLLKKMRFKGIQEPKVLI